MIGSTSGESIAMQCNAEGQVRCSVGGHEAPNFIHIHHFTTSSSSTLSTITLITHCPDIAKGRKFPLAGDGSVVSWQPCWPVATCLPVRGQGAGLVPPWGHCRGPLPGRASPA